MPKVTFKVKAGRRIPSFYVRDDSKHTILQCHRPIKSTTLPCILDPFQEMNMANTDHFRSSPVDADISGPRRATCTRKIHSPNRGVFTKARRASHRVRFQTFSQDNDSTQIMRGHNRTTAGILKKGQKFKSKAFRDLTEKMGFSTYENSEESSEDLNINSNEEISEADSDIPHTELSEPEMWTTAPESVVHFLDVARTTNRVSVDKVFQTAARHSDKTTFILDKSFETAHPEALDSSRRICYGHQDVAFNQEGNSRKDKARCQRSGDERLSESLSDALYEFGDYDYPSQTGNISFLYNEHPLPSSFSEKTRTTKLPKGRQKTVGNNSVYRTRKEKRGLQRSPFDQPTYPAMNPTTDLQSGSRQQQNHSIAPEDCAHVAAKHVNNTSDLIPIFQKNEHSELLRFQHSKFEPDVGQILENDQRVSEENSTVLGGTLQQESPNLHKTRLGENKFYEEEDNRSLKKSISFIQGVTDHQIIENKIREINEPENFVECCSPRHKSSRTESFEHENSDETLDNFIIRYKESLETQKVNRNKKKSPGRGSKANFTRFNLPKSADQMDKTQVLAGNECQRRASHTCQNTRMSIEKNESLEQINLFQRAEKESKENFNTFATHLAQDDVIWDSRASASVTHNDMTISDCDREAKNNCILELDSSIYHEGMGENEEFPKCENCENKRRMSKYSDVLQTNDFFKETNDGTEKVDYMTIPNTIGETGHSDPDATNYYIPVRVREIAKRLDALFNRAAMSGRCLGRIGRYISNDNVFDTSQELSVQPRKLSRPRLPFLDDIQNCSKRKKENLDETEQQFWLTSMGNSETSQTTATSFKDYPDLFSRTLKRSPLPFLQDIRSRNPTEKKVKEFQHKVVSSMNTLVLTPRTCPRGKVHGPGQIIWPRPPFMDELQSKLKRRNKPTKSNTSSGDVDCLSHRSPDSRDRSPCDRLRSSCCLESSGHEHYESERIRSVREKTTPKCCRSFKENRQYDDSTEFSDWTCKNMKQASEKGVYVEDWERGETKLICSENHMKSVPQDSAQEHIMHEKGMSCNPLLIRDSGESFVSAISNHLRDNLQDFTWNYVRDKQKDKTSLSQKEVATSSKRYQANVSTETNSRKPEYMYALGQNLCPRCGTSEGDVNVLRDLASFHLRAGATQDNQTEDTNQIRNGHNVSPLLQLSERNESSQDDGFDELSPSTADEVLIPKYQSHFRHFSPTNDKIEAKNNTDVISTPDHMESQVGLQAGRSISQGQPFWMTVVHSSPILPEWIPGQQQQQSESRLPSFPFQSDISPIRGPSLDLVVSNNAASKEDNEMNVVISGKRLGRGYNAEIKQFCRGSLANYPTPWVSIKSTASKQPELDVKESSKKRHYFNMSHNSAGRGNANGRANSCKSARDQLEQYAVTASGQKGSTHPKCTSTFLKNFSKTPVTLKTDFTVDDAGYSCSIRPLQLYRPSVERSCSDSALGVNWRSPTYEEGKRSNSALPAVFSQLFPNRWQQLSGLDFKPKGGIIIQDSEGNLFHSCLLGSSYLLEVDAEEGIPTPKVAPSNSEFFQSLRDTSSQMSVVTAISDASRATSVALTVDASFSVVSNENTEAAKCALVKETPLYASDLSTSFVGKRPTSTENDSVTFPYNKLPARNNTFCSNKDRLHLRDSEVKSHKSSSEIYSVSDVFSDLTQTHVKSFPKETISLSQRFVLSDSSSAKPFSSNERRIYNQEKDDHVKEWLSSLGGKPTFVVQETDSYPSAVSQDRKTEVNVSGNSPAKIITKSKKQSAAIATSSPQKRDLLPPSGNIAKAGEKFSRMKLGKREICTTSRFSDHVNNVPGKKPKQFQPLYGKSQDAFSYTTCQNEEEVHDKKHEKFVAKKPLARTEDLHSPVDFKSCNDLQGMYDAAGHILSTRSDSFLSAKSSEDRPTIDEFLPAKDAGKRSLQKNVLILKEGKEQQQLINLDLKKSKSHNTAVKTHETGKVSSDLSEHTKEQPLKLKSNTRFSEVSIKTLLHSYKVIGKFIKIVLKHEGFKSPTVINGLGSSNENCQSKTNLSPLGFSENLSHCSSFFSLETQNSYSGKAEENHACVSNRLWRRDSKSDTQLFTLKPLLPFQLSRKRTCDKTQEHKLQNISRNQAGSSVAMTTQATNNDTVSRKSNLAKAGQVSKNAQGPDVASIEKDAVQPLQNSKQLLFSGNNAQVQDTIPKSSGTGTLSIVTVSDKGLESQEVSVPVGKEVNSPAELYPVLTKDEVVRLDMPPYQSLVKSLSEDYSNCYSSVILPTKPKNNTAVDSQVDDKLGEQLSLESFSNISETLANKGEQGFTTRSRPGCQEKELEKKVEDIVSRIPYDKFNSPLYLSEAYPSFCQRHSTPGLKTTDHSLSVDNTFLPRPDSSRTASSPEENLSSPSDQEVAGILSSVDCRPAISNEVQQTTHKLTLPFSTAYKFTLPFSTADSPRRAESTPYPFAEARYVQELIDVDSPFAILASTKSEKKPPLSRYRSPSIAFEQARLRLNQDERETSPAAQIIPQVMERLEDYNVLAKIPQVKQQTIAQKRDSTASLSKLQNLASKSQKGHDQTHVLSKLQEKRRSLNIQDDQKQMGSKELDQDKFGRRVSGSIDDLVRFRRKSSDGFPRKQSIKKVIREKKSIPSIGPAEILQLLEKLEASQANIPSQKTAETKGPREKEDEVIDDSRYRNADDSKDLELCILIRYLKKIFFCLKKQLDPWMAKTGDSDKDKNFKGDTIGFQVNSNNHLCNAELSFPFALNLSDNSDWTNHATKSHSSHALAGFQAFLDQALYTVQKLKEHSIPTSSSAFSSPMASSSPNEPLDFNSLHALQSQNVHKTRLQQAKPEELEADSLSTKRSRLDVEEKNEFIEFYLDACLEQDVLENPLSAKSVSNNAWTSTSQEVILNTDSPSSSSKANKEVVNSFSTSDKITFENISPRHLEKAEILGKLEVMCRFLKLSARFSESTDLDEELSTTPLRSFSNADSENNGGRDSVSLDQQSNSLSGRADSDPDLPEAGEEQSAYSINERVEKVIQSLQDFVHTVHSLKSFDLRSPDGSNASDSKEELLRLNSVNTNLHSDTSGLEGQTKEDIEEMHTPISEKEHSLTAPSADELKTAAASYVSDSVSPNKNWTLMDEVLNPQKSFTGESGSMQRIKEDSPVSCYSTPLMSDDHDRNCSDFSESPYLPQSVQVSAGNSLKEGSKTSLNRSAFCFDADAIKYRKLSSTQTSEAASMSMDSKIQSVSQVDECYFEMIHSFPGIASLCAGVQNSKRVPRTEPVMYALGPNFVPGQFISTSKCKTSRDRSSPNSGMCRKCNRPTPTVIRERPFQNERDQCKRCKHVRDSDTSSVISNLSRARSYALEKVESRCTWYGPLNAKSNEHRQGDKKASSDEISSCYSESERKMVTPENTDTSQLETGINRKLEAHTKFITHTALEARTEKKTKRKEKTKKTAKILKEIRLPKHHSLSPMDEASAVFVSMCVVSETIDPYTGKPILKVTSTDKESTADKSYSLQQNLERCCSAEEPDYLDAISCSSHSSTNLSPSMSAVEESDQNPLMSSESFQSCSVSSKDLTVARDGRTKEPENFVLISHPSSSFSRLSTNQNAAESSPALPALSQPSRRYSNTSNPPTENQFKPRDLSRFHTSSSASATSHVVNGTVRKTRCDRSFKKVSSNRKLPAQSCSAWSIHSSTSACSSREKMTVSEKIHFFSRKIQHVKKSKTHRLARPTPLYNRIPVQNVCAQIESTIQRGQNRIPVRNLCAQMESTIQRKENRTPVQNVYAQIESTTKHGQKSQSRRLDSTNSCKTMASPIVGKYDSVSKEGITQVASYKNAAKICQAQPTRPCVRPRTRCGLPNVHRFSSNFDKETEGRFPNSFLTNSENLQLTSSEASDQPANQCNKEPDNNSKENYEPFLSSSASSSLFNCQVDHSHCRREQDGNSFTNIFHSNLTWFSSQSNAKNDRGKSLKLEPCLVANDDEEKLQDAGGTDKSFSADKELSAFSSRIIEDRKRVGLLNTNSPIKMSRKKRCSNPGSNPLDGTLLDTEKSQSPVSAEFNQSFDPSQPPTFSETEQSMLTISETGESVSDSSLQGSATSFFRNSGKWIEHATEKHLQTRSDIVAQREHVSSTTISTRSTISEAEWETTSSTSSANHACNFEINDQRAMCPSQEDEPSNASRNIPINDSGYSTKVSFSKDSSQGTSRSASSKDSYTTATEDNQQNCHKEEHNPTQGTTAELNSTKESVQRSENKPDNTKIFHRVISHEACGMTKTLEKEHNKIPPASKSSERVAHEITLPSIPSRISKNPRYRSENARNRTDEKAAMRSPKTDLQGNQPSSAANRRSISSSIISVGHTDLNKLSQWSLNASELNRIPYKERNRSAWNLSGPEAKVTSNEINLSQSMLAVTKPPLLNLPEYVGKVTKLFAGNDSNIKVKSKTCGLSDQQSLPYIYQMQPARCSLPQKANSPLVFENVHPVRKRIMELNKAARYYSERAKQSHSERLSKTQYKQRHQNLEAKSKVFGKVKPTCPYVSVKTGDDTRGHILKEYSVTPRSHDHRKQKILNSLPFVRVSSSSSSSGKGNQLMNSAGREPCRKCNRCQTQCKHRPNRFESDTSHTFNDLTESNLTENDSNGSFTGNKQDWSKVPTRNIRHGKTTVKTSDKSETIESAFMSKQVHITVGNINISANAKDTVASVLSQKSGFSGIVDVSASEIDKHTSVCESSAGNLHNRYTNYNAREANDTYSLRGQASARKDTQARPSGKLQNIPVSQKPPYWSSHQQSVKKPNQKAKAASHHIYPNKELGSNSSLPPSSEDGFITSESRMSNCCQQKTPKDLAEKSVSPRLCSSRKPLKQSIGLKESAGVDRLTGSEQKNSGVCSKFAYLLKMFQTPQDQAAEVTAFRRKSESSGRSVLSSSGNQSENCDVHATVSCQLSDGQDLTFFTSDEFSDNDANFHQESVADVCTPDTQYKLKYSKDQYYQDTNAATEISDRSDGRKNYQDISMATPTTNQRKGRYGGMVSPDAKNKGMKGRNKYQTEETSEARQTRPRLRKEPGENYTTHFQERSHLDQTRWAKSDLTPGDSNLRRDRRSGVPSREFSGINSQHGRKKISPESQKENRQCTAKSPNRNCRDCKGQRSPKTVAKLEILEPDSDLEYVTIVRHSPRVYKKEPFYNASDVTHGDDIGTGKDIIFTTPKDSSNEKRKSSPLVRQQKPAEKEPGLVSSFLAHCADVAMQVIGLGEFAAFCDTFEKPNPSGRFQREREIRAYDKAVSWPQYQSPRQEMKQASQAYYRPQMQSFRPYASKKEGPRYISPNRRELQKHPTQRAPAKQHVAEKLTVQESPRRTANKNQNLKSSPTMNNKLRKDLSLQKQDTSQIGLLQKESLVPTMKMGISKSTSYSSEVAMQTVATHHRVPNRSPHPSRAEVQQTREKSPSVRKRCGVSQVRTDSRAEPTTEAHCDSDGLTLYSPETVTPLFSLSDVDVPLAVDSCQSHSCSLPLSYVRSQISCISVDSLPDASVSYPAQRKKHKIISIKREPNQRTLVSVSVELSPSATLLSCYGDRSLAIQSESGHRVKQHRQASFWEAFRNMYMPSQTVATKCASCRSKLNEKLSSSKSPRRYDSASRNNNRGSTYFKVYRNEPRCKVLKSETTSACFPNSNESTTQTILSACEDVKNIVKTNRTSNHPYPSTNNNKSRQTDDKKGANKTKKSGKRRTKFRITTEPSTDKTKSSSFKIEISPDMSGSSETSSTEVIKLEEKVIPESSSNVTTSKTKRHQPMADKDVMEHSFPPCALKAASVKRPTASGGKTSSKMDSVSWTLSSDISSVREEATKTSKEKKADKQRDVSSATSDVAEFRVKTTSPPKVDMSSSKPRVYNVEATIKQKKKSSPLVTRKPDTYQISSDLDLSSTDSFSETPPEDFQHTRTELNFESAWNEAAVPQESRGKNSSQKSKFLNEKLKKNSGIFSSLCHDILVDDSSRPTTSEREPKVTKKMTNVHSEDKKYKRGRRALDKEEIPNDYAMDMMSEAMLNLKQNPQRTRANSCPNKGIRNFRLAQKSNSSVVSVVSSCNISDPQGDHQLRTTHNFSVKRNTQAKRLAAHPHKESSRRLQQARRTLRSQERLAKLAQKTQSVLKKAMTATRREIVEEKKRSRQKEMQVTMKRTRHKRLLDESQGIAPSSPQREIPSETQQSEEPFSSSVRPKIHCSRSEVSLSGAFGDKDFHLRVSTNSEENTSDSYRANPARSHSKHMVDRLCSSCVQLTSTRSPWRGSAQENVSSTRITAHRSHMDPSDTCPPHYCVGKFSQSAVTCCSNHAKKWQQFSWHSKTNTSISYSSFTTSSSSSCEPGVNTEIFVSSKQRGKERSPREKSAKRTFDQNQSRRPVRSNSLQGVSSVTQIHDVYFDKLQRLARRVASDAAKEADKLVSKKKNSVYRENLPQSSSEVRFLITLNDMARMVAAVSLTAIDQGITRRWRSFCSIILPQPTKQRHYSEARTRTDRCQEGDNISVHKAEKPTKQLKPPARERAMDRHSGLRGLLGIIEQCEDLLQSEIKLSERPHCLQSSAGDFPCKKCQISRLKDQQKDGSENQNASRPVESEFRKFLGNEFISDISMDNGKKTVEDNARVNKNPQNITKEATRAVKKHSTLTNYKSCFNLSNVAQNTQLSESIISQGPETRQDGYSKRCHGRSLSNRSSKPYTYKPVEDKRTMRNRSHAINAIESRAAVIEAFSRGNPSAKNKGLNGFSWRRRSRFQDEGYHAKSSRPSPSRSMMSAHSLPDRKTPKIFMSALPQDAQKSLRHRQRHYKPDGQEAERRRKSYYTETRDESRSSHCNMTSQGAEQRPDNTPERLAHDCTIRNGSMYQSHASKQSRFRISPWCVNQPSHRHLDNCDSDVRKQPGGHSRTAKTSISPASWLRNSAVFGHAKASANRPQSPRKFRNEVIMLVKEKMQTLTRDHSQEISRMSYQQLLGVNKDILDRLQFTSELDADSLNKVFREAVYRTYLRYHQPDICYLHDESQPAAWPDSGHRLVKSLKFIVKR